MSEFMGLILGKWVKTKSFNFSLKIFPQIRGQGGGLLSGGRHAALHDDPARAWRQVLWGLDREDAGACQGDACNLKSEAE